MPTQKIDPKVIFASDAPAIDKPPVFSDKTKGWGVARANDGRPEIKQMNKVQQDTDLKILWLNENAVLPYDASIGYPEGTVTLKDGSFKQLSSGSWVEFLDDFADKDAVKRGIANRYDSSLTYNIGERVVLTNGDIVKSTVGGNTNNPNVNMTGWVYSSLTPSKNLNDVLDKAQARTNLGVMSSSEVTTAIANAVPTIPNATETTAGKAKIATTAIAQAGVNDTDFITAKKLWSAVNCPQGLKPFSCVAWLSVDETTSPPTIEGSGNVSSVTLLSTGRLRVNFTNPMPDTNYAPIISIFTTVVLSNGTPTYFTITEKLTTSVTIATGARDIGVSAAQNFKGVYLGVFR